MSPIIGNRINPPTGFSPLEQGGLTVFIGNLINLIAVFGGLFAFINLVIGGFQFISSGGDAKAVSAAWTKIYMSLIGLVIIVSSYAGAAVIGQVFFGRWDAIINPTITGPGTP